MTTPSSAVPGYGTGRNVSGERDAGSRSGTGVGGDTTLEPGQYPPEGWGNAFFGGPLPDGTGAPGTAGAGGKDADPTVEAGQTVDSFTGLTGRDINDTGATGSTGADIPDGAGPDSVTFTRPGSFGSGSYAQDTVRAAVGGPADWTQANSGGYASGGPKLPGMQEPAPDTGPFQPGGGGNIQNGRVLRGGRAVNP